MAKSNTPMEMQRSHEPRAPAVRNSGCTGRTCSESLHSFDEGIDLRVRPDGDAAPVFVWRKAPSDRNIPMPHELGELLNRRARIEEHKIAVGFGIGKAQSRQLGGETSAAGYNPAPAVSQEILVTKACKRTADGKNVGGG